ncbi:hypothetical protein [Streptomyces sp. 3213.3]|uniref:hypothetical protein n=1 Tax=Streptomyces sp. 3213.3 TaxID=1855348 RepID=UPI000B8A02AC|nr:hypothetical protein [Streptomyces sp. 3213.3]
MREVTTQRVELAFEENGRHPSVCMAHADGSWARACAGWLDPPEVRQGGPRLLWDQLELIRNRLNAEGGITSLSPSTANLTAQKFEQVVNLTIHRNRPTVHLR